MKDGEIVRLACIYAEQDRESFIEAYERMADDPACVEAMEYLKALRSGVCDGANIARRRHPISSGHDLLRHAGPAS